MRRFAAQGRMRDHAGTADHAEHVWPEPHAGRRHRRHRIGDGSQQRHGPAHGQHAAGGHPRARPVQPADPGPRQLPRGHAEPGDRAARLPAHGTRRQPRAVSNRSPGSGRGDQPSPSHDRRGCGARAPPGRRRGGRAQLADRYRRGRYPARGRSGDPRGRGPDRGRRQRQAAVRSRPREARDHREPGRDGPRGPGWTGRAGPTRRACRPVGRDPAHARDLRRHMDRHQSPGRRSPPAGDGLRRAGRRGRPVGPARGGCRRRGRPSRR